MTFLSFNHWPCSNWWNIKFCLAGSKKYSYAMDYFWWPGVRRLEKIETMRVVFFLRSGLIVEGIWNYNLCFWSHKNDLKTSVLAACFRIKVKKSVAPWLFFISLCVIILWGGMTLCELHFFYNIINSHEGKKSLFYW